jgi:2-dehydro-3-deoxygluconokinase
MDHAREDVDAAIAEAIGSSRMSPKRVVTFGEASLRLATSDNERLERATTLSLSVSGPELNMAVATASLGVEVSWVSVLPGSPLGRRILRDAKANGVDVQHVPMLESGDGRAGLQFVEPGPEPRPTSVHYDVAGSPVSRLRAGTFDWASILDGASAFYVSGNTLGISAGARSEAMEAVRTARQLGVLVAFDLAYRPDSWSEGQARQAFVRIIHDVDVLFASRGSLRTFFGFEGSYESVLHQAIEKLGVAAVTVNRRRFKGSRRLTLESMAMGKSELLASSDRRDIEVVDSFGASDAYAAGFLDGYLENPLGLSRAVSLGAAAAALKCTMPGEFLCASRDEIEALVPD